MIRPHTTEALVGSKPVRVHCNTCQSQHSYRASEPGTRAPRAAGTGTPSGKYKTLLSGSNPAETKNYSPKETYRAGDVLQHPMFGVGVTTAVRDVSKIEVL